MLFIFLKPLARYLDTWLFHDPFASLTPPPDEPAGEPETADTLGWDDEARDLGGEGGTA